MIVAQSAKNKKLKIKNAGGGGGGGIAYKETAPRDSLRFINIHINTGGIA